MRNFTRLHINRSLARHGYEVYIQAGTTMVSHVTFTFEELKGDGRYVGPSAVLSDEDAQMLMDELWRAGLRPENGEGTDGHVNALKYHLEDMRKLVFKKTEA